MRLGRTTARWPQGMELGHNAHTEQINMLLFVREAWCLAKDLDLPALSPAPSTGNSHLPRSHDIETWEQRWHLQWKRAWDWYELEKSQVAPVTPSLMEKYSRPGQELNPSVPPFWFVEYGFDGIDQEAFYVWDKLIVSGAPLLNFKDYSSEIITAWENGLSTITTLPYHGYFMRRLSKSHLVVSQETLQDSDLFTVALTEWIAEA